MDKYGKNDNYIVYKNRWDYKMNILKKGENMYISVNKLNVLLKEKSIDDGVALNCYLHDLSRRCA